MNLDKRIFTGGMNQDDTQRLLPNGDYRYALNCNIATSDGSDFFVVENKKGNTLINFTLPAGTNKTIGNYEDKQNNKVYYFVFNSNGSHNILEYNYNTNTITRVLESSVLNFNTSYLITHVNVMEGELSWVDRLNPPRAINVAKAKLHSQGNFTQGYASPFIEEYCDVIRYAPICHPTCSYADDSTKDVNYLTNKLFQFRYAYWYFDFQSCTMSPISTVPLPAIVCGNTSVNTKKNCLINVTVKTGSAIATRIVIFAREGNLGAWKEIVDLDKSKLNIASNGTYTFPFYNEKIYNDADIKWATLLFDNVPLNAGAQEIIENRRVYGDVLEGQDPVQIEAKLNLAYKQDISTATFSCSGKIEIKNPWTTSASATNYQPIHNPQNDGNSANYVWGGANGTIISPSIGWVGAVGTDYQQTIPLGGFVAYLAGTPYKAVSRQNPPQGGYGAVQDANGVYGTDTNPQRNDVIREMQDGSVYSTFTINGIPPGDYVLRVAGHQTTQTQLDDLTRPYERTSTNVVQVGGASGTEVRIHIDQNGTVTVNGSAVTVTNGTFQVGETHIIDLTAPSALVASTALTGYVTDCDVQPTPTTYATLLADTRIELASVHFTNANFASNNGVINNYPWITEWNNGVNAAFTDHNGYFFFCCEDGLSGNVTVDTLFVAGIGSPVVPNNFNTSGAAFSGVGGSQGAQIVTRAPGASSPFNGVRTAVSGTVLDNNNNPIEGATIVIGHSRVEESDPNGQWEVLIYGNSFDFWASPVGIAQRNEYINYSLSDGCIGVFSGSPDQINIAINSTATGQTVFASPYAGNYSNVSSNYGLLVIDQIVTVTGGGSSTKADKRGGIYQYGIVYYKEGNQSGLTNTTDGLFTTKVTTNGYGLRMEIPFYTQPSGSTIVGQLMPEISWQIFSLPPVWATHWQWVRTLNSATNNYIQFVAKKIYPTDDSRTVTTFGSATKLGFDISNIVDYNTRYTDSEGNVTYDFVQGDRIRMIRDAAGNFYNQYFDFEIRDFDPAGIVYINYVSAIGQPTAGCLFEIYTPKKKADQELYYEFGECYEVGNPGASNRYHKGQSQDQNPTNPVTVPATGTFTEGDTYYRTRSMLFLNSSSQASYANRIIEAPSFSDFFPSEVIDIGRPNRVDNNYRQVRRPTTIYHTEIIIPETNINGLNRIYDTSFETYDRQKGSIQRLYADNHVLEVYQVKKCGEVPINQRYLYNAGGDNQLVTTDSFFNEINYMTGDYGIYYNPESFAVFGNNRYFIDLAAGVVLRKNIDGLTPISEYKMHSYFTGKSKTYISNNILPRIYGAYDKRFDQYILCFEVAYPTSGETVSLASVPGETIAFSEKNNRWEEFLSFLPENIGPAGTEIVSFSNGRIYLHNSNSVYNNFYGVQYSTEIWPVCNLESSNVKVLLTLSTESTHPWEAYDIITPGGQSSNLITSDFQLLEGIYYASVLRDVNTPNITDPIINGDAMRDVTFLAKLRNSQTTSTKLFAVNFGVIASERSNK